MDRFPEAFHRFERVVDHRTFHSARELKYVFTHWAGRRWVDSHKQNLALQREAEKRGFEETKLPRYSRRFQFSAIRTWKFETVIVGRKA
jgi:hypothetical protein